MLGAYIAAVLGRPLPAGVAAEPPQDSGIASVSNGAGTNSSASVDQASAGGGAPGDRADSDAAAANPATADGAEAAVPDSTPASESAAARPQQSHRHWPCSIVLNPIADKTVRTAVHKFFREDRRIPAFRTETAQQQKKSTKASVRRRHLLRPRCCLSCVRMQAYFAMKMRPVLRPHHSSHTASKGDQYSVSHHHGNGNCPFASDDQATMCTDSAVCCADPSVVGGHRGDLPASLK